MKKIIEVKGFKTSDDKFFENYSDAEKHQIEVEIEIEKRKKEDEIISLLGGDDFGTSFSNGDGIYIIDIENLKEAEEKIEEFKKELGLDEYDIKSRMAYENIYLNTISHIISCIFQNEKNEFVRVGQVYFKNHRDELGSKIYT